MPRVLHALSQRPSLTGSGITLEALVRNAGPAGWDQDVVVAVPADDPEPRVADLPLDRIHPLIFGTSRLPFPVPGMSDVMPYPSTRFSSMDAGQIQNYVEAWTEHLAGVVASARPDLIHSHHVWLMTSILRRVAPSIPIVTHCHATGIRQMELCPHLADRIRSDCLGIDRFGVLHRVHQEVLGAALGVPEGRVHIVGAGYREDLFHARGRAATVRPRVLYIGKYSVAKGLPCLLDAAEALWAEGVGFELHVAGGGAGAEADGLRSRMQEIIGPLELHGQLPQPDLARLMRQSAVVVLPSFYEGLPLVLVEAFASGCRVVATGLPGVIEQLAPALGDGLELVDLPGMVGVDTPAAADLPAFTARLRTGLLRALEAPPLGDPLATRPEALAPLTWAAVFQRVETIWLELLNTT